MTPNKLYAGMNDVLPKPFTKDGLLGMLEKYLGHLKKQPPNIDTMPPPLNSGKRSIEGDDSPSTSPATGSNWNSPNNLTGGSPSTSNLTDDPYLPTGLFGQTGMSAASIYGSNTAALGMAGRPQPQAQHRRNVSDMTGGPDMPGDVKRQQMYAPGMGPHIPRPQR